MYKEEIQGATRISSNLWMWHVVYRVRKRVG